MKIKLEGLPSPGFVAEEQDVRQVKRTLGCWGYYTPDPATA